MSAGWSQDKASAYLSSSAIFLLSAEEHTRQLQNLQAQHQAGGYAYEVGSCVILSAVQVFMHIAHNNQSA